MDNSETCIAVTGMKILFGESWFDEESKKENLNKKNKWTNFKNSKLNVWGERVVD